MVPRVWWVRRTGWDCLALTIKYFWCRRSQTQGSVNGLVLESMAICLCIVEPMLISVRLGNMEIPGSFACSFKKRCWILSWSGTELYQCFFSGNLIGRFAVDIGRFIREICLICVQKRQAKSASLRNKLLEQMEAESSSGNDKTVTVHSLPYWRNA